MSEQTKVTLISDQGKTLEDLRAQVEAIGKAVDAIKKSGITDAALIALIIHACPVVPTGKYKQKAKPNARTIKAVIAGMENLRAYVFKQKTKA